MGRGIRNEKAVTCLICKSGHTHAGKTTVTLERGKTTLVVKDVPARICGTCGEAYVDGTTSKRLLEDAEAAAASGVQVEIKAFAA